MQCRALSVAPAQVMPLFKDNAALNNIPKSQHRNLVNQAKILSQDFSKYMADLEAIYAKHKGKSGSTTSPDELMEVLNIGEEYQKWMTSFQLVVLPTVAEITALFEPEDRPEAAAKVVQGDFIPAKDK